MSPQSEPPPTLSLRPLREISLLLPSVEHKSISRGTRPRTTRELLHIAWNDARAQDVRIFPRSVRKVGERLQALLPHLQIQIILRMQRARQSFSMGRKPGTAFRTG